MNRTIFFLIIWNIFFFVPIIGTIDAQGARLIVDSSFFEMFPSRDPFTPQVPQEVRTQRVVPVVPVEVVEPVAVPPVPIVQEPPAEIPHLEEVVSQPVEPVGPPSNLKISGLVWNTDRPQAIINGKITEVGDMVSGFKIVDIQKTGITVLSQGRTVTIGIESRSVGVMP